jgi:hypothetical protein
MAVLIEGISVVVLRSAIEQKLLGGWSAFEQLVPNQTLCADRQLARVGFMHPNDVQAFVARLTVAGLLHLERDCCQDLAVVDQQSGPTRPAPWLRFARGPLDSSGATVALAWSHPGAPGVEPGHFEAALAELATPANWCHARSISAEFSWVPTEDIDARLEILNHTDGVDRVRDRVTGQVGFIGRST